ncbi:MAG: hypothetical protein D6724_00015, partial [Armatimonadetes bacterium]
MRDRRPNQRARIEMTRIGLRGFASKLLDGGSKDAVQGAGVLVKNSSSGTHATRLEKGPEHSVLGHAQTTTKVGEPGSVAKRFGTVPMVEVLDGRRADSVEVGNEFLGTVRLEQGATNRAKCGQGVGEGIGKSGPMAELLQDPQNGL